MWKLSNLYNYSEDTYKGTSNGITYNITVVRRGYACTFHIVYSGTATTGSPIFLTLPLKYRPAIRTRLYGYGETIHSNGTKIIEAAKILIEKDGRVLCGLTAGFKVNNGEIGCGYLALTETF